LQCIHHSAAAIRLSPTVGSDATAFVGFDDVHLNAIGKYRKTGYPIPFTPTISADGSTVYLSSIP